MSAEYKLRANTVGDARGGNCLCITVHAGALLSSLGSDIRAFTMQSKMAKKGVGCLQLSLLICLYL